jgi:prepilin-type N-terminal cleavage/methylation domain-containing protein
MELAPRTVGFVRIFPEQGLLMARRAGFTLIELAITLVVSGVLLTMVGRALGDAQRRIAADQAMKTYEAMHARARAHAIERGTNVLLVLDTSADTAAISIGGDVIETTHFRAELGVDVWSDASNPVQVCMTSRGYGDASCMSFNSTVRLSFGTGSDTSSVQLLSLGQLKR